MAKNSTIVEKSTVNSKYVSCDGGSSYGHPKIYLKIGQQKNIKCPYCGQIFVYKPKDISSNQTKKIG